MTSNPNRMSIINAKELLKLEYVVLTALEYVGMANYQHREDWAKKEVARCFAAYLESKYDEIEFRGEPR